MSPTGKRRAGETRQSSEGVDELSGAHRQGRGRAKPHEDALAEAVAAEGLPAGAGPEVGTGVTRKQLDERERKQSPNRKAPGPSKDATPEARPTAPPPTAPPPTDPR
jgi:hypothetical protein